MALPFKPSKELLGKMQREGMLNKVKDYAFKLRFFNTIVRYLRDRKYKNYSQDLVKWISTPGNLKLPSRMKKWVANLRLIKSRDAKMRQILRYVNKEIEYITDSKNDSWKVTEYWSTPVETTTIAGYMGDCEDGAILIYAIAKEAGIPDDCMWIVAGDVQGGGHAYIVYESEDDYQEYPLDWCYWFSKSVLMNKPYYLRDEYYSGTREWFRFNASGGYKLR